MAREVIFNEQQKQNLKNARNELGKLLELSLDSRINPLTEEWNIILDIMEDIETLLGY